MLEQRDASLAPELPTEEQRGIGGACQHRPGNRLGDVVETREVLRRDLEMDLKAGVAGLEHDVVVGDVELVAAFDVEPIALAPQAIHRIVQGEVARPRGHVIQGQERLFERRQDAAEHHFGVELASGFTDLVKQLVELLLHLSQRVVA